MLIFRKYKFFFKIIIIIFKVLILSLITSCTLKDFKKNNDFLLDERKNQLKTLIIPEGVTFPSKNEKYDIPLDKDLEKKNYDIFPPI